MKHPYQGGLSMEGSSDWRDDAECRGKDTEIFFSRTDRAIEICKRCPVIQQCLEEALSYGLNGQHGVRGGKTEKERKDIIRERMKLEARKRLRQEEPSVVTL